MIFIRMIQSIKYLYFWKCYLFCWEIYQIILQNFVIKHIIFFYIGLLNIYLSRALHYRIIAKFYLDILYLGGVYCNFNLGCGRVISCPFSIVMTKAYGIAPCTLEKLVKKTKILKLTVVFLVSCIKLSRSYIRIKES